MVITFDLQGRDRKQLVKAIADITGARPVYKFMPTCAFEIDFFTVTKEGTLEFPDRSEASIPRQRKIALTSNTTPQGSFPALRDYILRAAKR